MTFIQRLKRTCYNGVYPFKVFPVKALRELDFGPITIFCGGNGSGKSTLLNVIAEKLGVLRHSAFSGGAFFTEYVSMCEAEHDAIPGGSQILTSDDVFDYMLNIRYLNDGIDVRRNELLEDWIGRKYASHRFSGMDDYEDWKESYDAKSKSQSQYVRERLMRNVDMHSNGESAMKYFVDHIRENALYLMDEPENSLAVGLQKDLGKYISDSARHFGCQFVLATHSPVLLSTPGAVIYDLDKTPVCTKKWTELENVKTYFEFFEQHRSEFAGN
ncbi:MAG: AAA family ATPase [Oscillospiraceae bacterium]|nr:AAA family ATPase [Oscillospiraceae bacterium]